MNTRLPVDYRSPPLLQALVSVLAALLLAGCATTTPYDSALLPANNVERSDELSIAAVRKQPAAHAQSEVIWGGTIATAEHRDSATWVEVIERPLNRGDQPDLSQVSGGRFIAVVPEFLDLTDFRAGMPFTIDGRIDGIQIRSIGESAYELPKVTVADYQLWMPATQTIARHDHYHNDDYYAYRSPVRTRVSISLGIGLRSTIRLGLSALGIYRDAYYHNRHGRDHRGHRGIRGNRDNRQFENGRSNY